jgi:hypothetical protein
VADLRVRLQQWSYGWQHRRLATAWMLYQMFVRLMSHQVSGILVPERPTARSAPAVPADSTSCARE